MDDRERYDVQRIIDGWLKLDLILINDRRLRLHAMTVRECYLNMLCELSSPTKWRLNYLWTNVSEDEILSMQNKKRVQPHHQPVLRKMDELIQRTLSWDLDDEEQQRVVDESVNEGRLARYD